MPTANIRRHLHETRNRPSGINNRKDVQRDRFLLLTKRWIGGAVLAPACLVTAVTLIMMLWRAVARMGFLRSEEFIFFAFGGVLWAVAYLAGVRPVTAYVFGHEFSHLMTARLFGGRIFDWKVSAEGGYVETDKSNTWITLAPYLIPFYTLVIMLLFGILGLALDMQQGHDLHLWKLTVHLKPLRLLYALVGFTWWFHATYTYKTVVAEQGDLKRNGEFFSMMLIFLINAFLLIALFLASSPSPGLGFLEVARCWWSVATGILGWVWHLVF
ncbi:hypothetical protein [Prosthecobacter vanneervenii]|uniref:Uncharacterized protein n=1 Tax=Prosthecobacter vanneervenii TaxID=48466 RepID=A0A7W7Y931_9BACT|nr:hypothetical protein [Prosthecobacter vanneervenii]MBB5031882.1 hypothetical protein [Prosthecobacter vanneervenii]